MKMLLKILVAPFALALSLLAALLVFLFDICAVLPSFFRRMDCKRRRAPFSGRWTEANPLCTGF